MRVYRVLFLFGLFVILASSQLFVASAHAAICADGPPGYDSGLTISPSYWAPGQSYNVTLTEPQADLTNNGVSGLSPNLFVVTTDNFNEGNYTTEDPSVTVTNETFVNASTVTFTVTVAANAPTEDDGIALECVGETLVDGPDTGFITPCAITPTPTISSISPSAIFAGETTSVTITGTNFIPDGNANNCLPTEVSIFTGDENILTGLDVVSPTEITATVAPDADETDLTATAEIGNYIYNGGGTISATATTPVLPVPVIQWTNAPSGSPTDISTADGSRPPTQSTIVGNPIDLTLDPSTLPSGITVTQNTWTVGGTNIGGYDPDNDSASVTPTTTTNPSLDTYWVYPSTSRSPFSVTYDYCYQDPVAGQECSPTATSQFSVSGPSGGKMTFTPYSSAVSIATLAECISSEGDIPGGPYMVYATNPSGTACSGGLTYSTPGITFGTPTKYKNSSDGNFFLIQLISDDTVNEVNTGPGLDTEYPYQAPPPTMDDPSIYLGTTAGTVSRNFTANLFLMWQSTVSGAIPIPLGYQTWGFNGTATCTESCSTYTNWTASTDGTPGPVGSFTASSASQTMVGNNTLIFGYPTWSANVR